MRSLLCITLFGLALIPALWLHADDPLSKDDRPVNVEDHSREAPPPVPPRRRAPLQRSRSAPLPADLKSVELEFMVDRDQTLALVATAGRFATSTDVVNLRAELDVRIEGELQALPSGDRWLLTFDATMHRNDIDNDNDVVFSAAGSAVVSLNSKVTLARLPGPDLTVTIRPVREQPAE